MLRIVLFLAAAETATDGNSTFHLLSMSQLTLNFEPGVAERWPTLREYVAYRAQVTAKHLKVQAADMDMAPSTLFFTWGQSQGWGFKVGDRVFGYILLGAAVVIPAYIILRLLNFRR